MLNLCNVLAEWLGPHMHQWRVSASFYLFPILFIFLWQECLWSTQANGTFPSLRIYCNEVSTSHMLMAAMLWLNSCDEGYLLNQNHQDLHLATSTINSRLIWACQPTRSEHVSVGIFEPWWGEQQHPLFTDQPSPCFLMAENF